MNTNEKTDLTTCKFSPEPRDAQPIYGPPEDTEPLIIGKNPGNWITRKSYIIIALCLLSTIMCILGTYAYFRYL